VGSTSEVYTFAATFLVTDNTRRKEEVPGRRRG